MEKSLCPFWSEFGLGQILPMAVWTPAHGTSLSRGALEFGAVPLSQGEVWHRGSPALSGWVEISGPAWVWIWAGQGRVRVPKDLSCTSQECGKFPYCLEGWYTAHLLLFFSRVTLESLTVGRAFLFSIFYPLFSPQQNAPSALVWDAWCVLELREWLPREEWLLACLSPALVSWAPLVMLSCVPAVPGEGLLPVQGSTAILPFPSQPGVLSLTHSWQHTSLCPVCFLSPFSPVSSFR